MTKYSVGGNFYQPFWASSAHQADAAIPAGVTFVTSPPHPFAAIGEKYLKFDGNDATSHQMDLTNAQVGVGESSDYAGLGSTPPDNTLGWCVRSSMIFQMGTTLPSSDAVIMRSKRVGITSQGCDLYYKTDGTVKLVRKSDSVVLATSTLTLPTATDMQLEIIERFKNASGVNLTDHQFVVRYGTIATPPVYTTLINVLAATSSQQDCGAISSGETTQRGAGFVYYVGNAVCAWENADDLYGLLRIDRLDPDGTGHLNTWPGDATKVDESGTAVPDDTDFNSMTYSSGLGNADQLYSESAGQTAAGDTVIRVRQTQRFKCVSSKGTLTYGFIESDGTNDRTASTIAPGTVFAEGNQLWHKNASNAAWAQTDIAGLQYGQHATSSTDATSTFSMSVQTVTVLYEKSGETGTALPAAPRLRDRALIVRQAVNRSNTH